MPSDNGIEPGFVDDLLALETREQQTEFLRAADLLNADGLNRLLDIADELLGGDPNRSHRLAELSATVADGADAPAVVPRSAYMRVRTYFESGEFFVALCMVESSYDQFVSLGMNLEALRTRVGKMAVLLELGRYREALDAGQIVLDTLDGKGELTVDPSKAQVDSLAAPVYQNRGWCLEYMGRYDEALDAYSTAEGLYRVLGLTQRVGEVIDNRGAILSHLGRSSEALVAHQTAADVFEHAGLTLSYAKSIGNKGLVHLQIGNYALSLGVFERARQLFESLGALAAQQVVYFVATAEAYLALNLYSEATAACRAANGLLRKGGMTHLQAKVLWSLGAALIARSEFEEAERILSEAAAVFKEAGNIPLLSDVMLEQASLLEARGNKEAAIDKAIRALDLVAESEWPVQAIYAHLRAADLQLPDTNKVELHLDQAQQLAEQLTLPQLRYRLEERLGHLRMLQGRNEEARTLLESAVNEIERLRGTVTRDTMRASFLRDKAAAYEELLQLHLSRENEEGNRQAFAAAEKAKSRSLVDLLSGVGETKAGASADPKLEMQLQNRQADLNAVYNELLDGSGRAGREISLSGLQARAVELEQEISRLRLQATASEPVVDPFADARSDVVSDRLSSDELMVAYHVVGNEIMAFVVGSGFVKVSRQLGMVTVVQELSEKLVSQWGRFRAGREFAAKHLTMLERSARQVLSALYEQLVAPLELLVGEMAGKTNQKNDVQKLVVVPHGLLHQVPFHALFDGERYLIDRFEISYAPSAMVYVLCQERESGYQDKALAFGIDDPTIPAATAEIRTIVERLPETEGYVGEAATVDALRNEVSRCGTLHLACHGLFRSDNPMFSALKLHDGWLMAADAMSLDLDGALVTLSACESGRSEVYGGDETIGLTRAFLGAGAATLVVSLWLVQDETTAELMSGWYERLRAGEGRAVALRAAQLEVKERHPHPYYWAPFVLIGKR